MAKLVAGYILGIISFVLLITGIFSLLFSIPGLFLSFASLKLPEKKITIPIGYQGTLGNKKISAQPYVSSRYLAFVAIGLNAFSAALSVITTLSLFAFFTTATK